MKKSILLLAGLLAICTTGRAQYKNFTSENESNFKLIQIDQYDEATLFFFQTTADEDRKALSVADNIKITVTGDYKTYHLQQTLNMPFSSENKYAYFQKKGDVLNFVLVFDRIPLDKPFSMIEKEGKSGYWFNFKDITIDLSKESEKIEADDFAQATDYVTREKYTANGQEWMSYNINGLAVDTHLEGEYLNLTRVGKFNIVITNDSGRPVSVSPDNITVKVAKNERSELVEIPLWELGKYDQKVAGQNSLNVSAYEDEINPIASVLGSYRTRRGNDASLGERLALASAEIIARASTQSKVDAYADALEKNRQKVWEEYLQTMTLDNGESYGGYVTFKDKNYSKYVITITIGGHDYTFYING